MKKIRLIFVLICLLALCTLTLVSCGNRLDSPSGFTLDLDAQTLSWQKVKDARFYTVEISGQEKPITTKATKVSLEDLAPGNYEIRVMANGDGETVDDSKWATYNFTREYETGLRYQLINNNTEYELIGGGTAAGDVVMESTFRGKPVTSIAAKALYSNSKITSFTVGANVKTIGDKAFGKCSKLTSLTIPEGVTSIGADVFQNCKVITSITLPDSIKVVPTQAFFGCDLLANVTLGQYVTTISDRAFYGCKSLVSIGYTGCDKGSYQACLPNTVKSLGEYAFSGCIELVNINLGNGVEIINTYAFNRCEKLENVNLGTSLTALGDYAFFECIALKSIAIPDATTLIGKGAFLNCAALANVKFGNGLQRVGQGVLWGTAYTNAAAAANKEVLIVDGWIIEALNKAITKVNIKADQGVYAVADYAFSECTELLRVDFKGVKNIGYAAFNGCTNLNYAIFDNSLIEIFDYAFYSCSSLSIAEIGSSVTSIGSYAFYGCAALKEVSIPDTVTNIGTRAFRGTGAYSAAAPTVSSKSVVVYMGNWVVDYVPGMFDSMQPAQLISINAGVRGIASYTFSKQNVLVFKLPDSIEYICEGAFNKCAATYVINLPANLKYIGDYAFYNCAYANFGSSATFDITIPEGTQYIGRSAFYGCTNNLSLTVPKTVKHIGPYAFYGCANIGRTHDFEISTGEKDQDGNDIVKIETVVGFIKFENGIEYIGDRAFQGCANISTVNLPDSVKHLGARVFYKCDALKEVSIGNGLTTIVDYAFYKCTALEKITVSDNLETIGNYAFRGCTSLKEFDLKSVKSIGRYAFYGCTAMTSITLPDTLTSIGDYAFRGCKAVQTIVIPSSVTNIGKHVFYGLNNATLYCESQTIMPYWDNKFNSSYRPVFWGCTLSDDNKYVVSFTAGDKAIANALATNGISNPVKDGYIFAGWATEQGSTAVAYTSENVSEAKAGTVLYAVWTQQNEN